MEILFPLQFSSSIFEDTSCQTRFFRRWCEKLKNQNNIHLEAGSLFAKGLEIVRDGFFNKNLASEEAIEIGYDFISSSKEINSENKNITNLAFALKRYFKTFPLEGNLKPVELINDSYAIEYPFKLDTGISHPDFPDRNIFFTGKLDFIARETSPYEDDIIYIVDDKTTQSIFRIKGSKEYDLQKEEAMYSTRGQFIGYHYAAHKIGIPTTRTLVRRVPLLKEPEVPFELKLEINQYMLDSWEYSFLSTIEELKDRYLFYKNSKDISRSFRKAFGEACNSFHTKCPYYVGCLSKEGNEMLELTYQQLVSYPEYGDGTNPISLDEFKIKVLNGEI